MIDIEKIRQVLVNILINAIQATDREGTLKVTTALSHGYVKIAIQDSGMGMNKETISRIFEPFFTTKEPGEGTGLGLSVSYGIVKDHGGRIEVESEEGRGSIFTVFLPVEK